MVPAKRPTDSILGHFRQVHGQLLEHVHYIYLIDLSRLFFDDSKRRIDAEPLLILPTPS